MLTKLTGIQPLQVARCFQQPLTRLVVWILDGFVTTVHMLKLQRVKQHFGLYFTA